MVERNASAKRKSHIVGVLAVSASLVAIGTAQGAGTRPLVIRGYDQAITSVGRGLDPDILHHAPDPYERSTNVEYYSSLIAQSRRTPMPQRISGTCAEACTMRLAIRGACVDRNAELWFLPARTSLGLVQRERTRQMFSVLPGAIGRWAYQNTNANVALDTLRANASLFNASYSTGNSYGNMKGPNFAVLTGAQAIALGATGCR